MSDLNLLTIAARHNEDDVWFKAGHHDPNGYIGMAHRDRGDLLKIVSGETHCPQPDTITIPKAAWDWLMGEGPDDRGAHFGEDLKIDHMGCTVGGAFWWRTTFRRMCGL